MIFQVVSQYSSLLAPLAVDAVLNVIDPACPDNVDLRDIKVLKKLGGTVSVEHDFLLGSCCLFLFLLIFLSYVLHNCLVKEWTSTMTKWKLMKNLWLLTMLMLTLEQVDDTEMVKGLVFDHKASHLAGGPTRVENAKIGLIQFQISPPKTDIEQSVIVSDYTQVSLHLIALIHAGAEQIGF